ncbi:MAG: methyltransferase domain-containing protein [Chloroflexota bacterium]|nr:methyltransferase domain-containing protein [Chloroflexota bacterium]
MNPTYTRSDSKVEVSGAEARHYDFFMNTITVGTYPFFIRKAIREMGIQPGDEILVLGCGTGRNLQLMNKHLDGEGRIVGLDIGPEMLEQAQRRFADLPHVTIKNQHIDEPLSYENEFDKVFISFVMHGFIQEDREKIIANAQRALRPGGEFIILDYNEFNLGSSPWPVRFVFKMECPLATDFVGRDFQAILRKQGFDEFRVHPHYFGYVRLLAARLGDWL